MDDPVTIIGGKHRNVRHNINTTPEQAEHIFKEETPIKYQPFIQDAVLDHLLLDKKTNDNLGFDIPNGHNKNTKTITVSITSDQDKWLTQNHPKINRSRLVQDKISDMMNGDNNQLIKTDPKLMKYITLMEISQIIGFIILGLLFLFD
jgi:hypothetical protein